MLLEENWPAGCVLVWSLVLIRGSIRGCRWVGCTVRAPACRVACGGSRREGLDPSPVRVRRQWQQQVWHRDGDAWLAHWLVREVA